MRGHRPFATKITAIMRTHVLISLLLVCAAAGSPVATSKNNIFRKLRTPSILAMSVLDDNGEVVEIDLEADDDETLGETKQDLDNRVFFYLHTSNNPQAGQPIYIDDSETLARTRYDPKKPTKFIIHGWLNTRTSAISVLIRDAYLRHGDYNVIVVDWGRITQKPYLWVTRRVLMVGQQVGKMIDFLIKHDQDVTQLSLVGHSLGAHVSGIAAYNAQARIPYVVGLDPALPGFAFARPGQRISTEDADYVEIIHSNAGLLGYKAQTGHADFYPNGGSKQTGCTIDVGGSCSHARSFRFYAESINTKIGFHSYPCKNYISYKMGFCSGADSVQMGGIKLDTSARGTYFLSTNGKPPYARGP